MGFPLCDFYAFKDGYDAGSGLGGLVWHATVFIIALPWSILSIAKLFFAKTSPGIPVAEGFTG